MMSDRENVNRGFSLQRALSDPLLLVAILFVLASLILFILYPLFSILKNSFLDSSGIFTFSSYRNTFRNVNFLSAFSNTVTLGVTVGVTATVVGFIFAYVIVCVKSPFKGLFNAVTIAPIISPPFVLAFSAISLLGRRGFITYKLLGLRNWDIYGFNGLVLVQTMTFFPVVTLLLTGLMKNLDVSMEEAARDLGASRLKVFTSITLPMLLSGIANSFLLTFVESVTDFANPMILGSGFKTLASQIYIQAVANYDMQLGTTIAVILLLLTVVIFYVQKAWLDKRSYVTLTGKASREREMIDSKGVTFLGNAFCLVCSLFILLFYVFIVLGAFFRTWGADYTLVLNNFKYIFERGFKPVTDTLNIALLSAPIGGVLAMVVAYLIVRKRFFGRTLVEYSSMLGMAVPGTVFGLGYILSFNTRPLVLTNTLIILVIVLVMTRLPVGVRSGVAALKQIDPSIEEAASNLGANTSKVFLSITIPLIKPAFFSGLVFSFIKSMTAISAVIFLVSAKYNLLTVRVMQYVDKGLMGYASAMATILIVIVFAVVGIMSFLLGRMGISQDEIYR